MMPGYRLRTSEEGGSMVETALLSLLMVPIIVYANFFFDFSFANLKALEASRYAAWELTAVRLSDWVGENHSNFFTTESGIIINEVESLLRCPQTINAAFSVDLACILWL